MIIKPRLYMCCNDAEIQISLVSAGTHISAGTALHHIINGFIPVLPAFSSEMDPHDLLVVNPSPGGLPCLHKFIAVKGDCLLILTQNRSAVAVCHIVQTVCTIHGLKAIKSRHILIILLKLAGCLSYVLPGGKHLIRIQPHFLEHILSVIDHLCCSPRRKSIDMPVFIPQIIQEGINNVFFIKVRICSDKIIQILNLSLLGKISGGMMICQITGGYLTGCDGSLHHFCGLNITGLGNASDNHFIL